MKIYEVRLEKIVSNHGYLGVDKVNGVILDFPTIGNRFKVFVDPTELNVEYIETTPVENIEHIDNEYRVHTANSHYHVTILREIND